MMVLCTLGAGGVGQSGRKVGERRHRLAVASRSLSMSSGRRLSSLYRDIIGLKVFFVA